jgi:hypothetical protein
MRAAGDARHSLIAAPPLAEMPTETVGFAGTVSAMSDRAKWVDRPISRIARKLLQSGWLAGKFEQRHSVSAEICMRFKRLQVIERSTQKRRRQAGRKLPPHPDGAAHAERGRMWEEICRCGV